MRTGVDDRHFTGLPVSNVDEHLDAATDVKNLLGLAEIQDALGAGYRGRGSGDRNLSPRPSRNFRESRPDVARESARPGRRELGEEHECQQAGEHDAAEDE